MSTNEHTNQAPAPGDPGFHKWVAAEAARMRQAATDSTEVDLGSFTTGPGEDGRAAAFAMLAPFLEG